MTDHLPKAVQAQVERAEAALLARGNPGQPAAEDENKLQAEEPEATPPEAQAPKDKGVPGKELPYDPALERRYTSQKEWENADHPDYWKHRFGMLQGKYNKEVEEVLPGMRARIDALTEALAQAKQSPSKVPTESPPKATNPPDEKLKQIHAKLTDEFGEETGNALLELIESRVAPLEQRTKEQEEQAKAEEAERIRQQKARTLAALDRRRPDWRAIDGRADWQAWLGTFDPRTGQTRQQQLENRLDASDDEGLDSLFATFLEGIGEEPGANAAGSAPADPSDRVMPDSRGSSAVPPGKRMWTKPEIGAAFDEIRRGKYAPEQAEALKDEIFAAMRENRVRS